MKWPPGNPARFKLDNCDDDDRDPFIISRTARAKHERAQKQHQETLSALAAVLTAAGFLPEENRFIDLYAFLRSDHGIFEVKSIHPKNERSQFRSALSQLYEYRFLHSLKPASLWLVLSQKPTNSMLVGYLEHDRNVRVIWREGDSFGGPGWTPLQERLQIR